MNTLDQRRDPGRGRMMAPTSELRALAGVLAVIVGTGLVGSLFPAAEATITTTVTLLAVVGLVARMRWWQVGEYRADRADATAAAATAYLTRQRGAV